MLQEKRHMLIFKYINENGCARVNELSSLFDVSQETIRRDLSVLAKGNKILRSFGGAVLPENNVSFLDVSRNISNELPIDKAESFIKRAQESPEFKIKIAKAASHFINEYECIMIDSSSTCLSLARQIPDIPLTVITNSLNIIQALACREKVKIICVGGEYAERHSNFYGPIAELIIKNFKVNKYFFSCQSIGHGYDVRDGNELNVRLKQEMMKVSDKKILLADSRKFDKYSLYKICDLDDVDILITNKLPSEDYQRGDVKVIEAN